MNTKKIYFNILSQSIFFAVVYGFSIWSLSSKKEIPGLEEIYTTTLLSALFTIFTLFRSLNLLTCRAEKIEKASLGFFSYLSLSLVYILISTIICLKIGLPILTNICVIFLNLIFLTVVSRKLKKEYLEILGVKILLINLSVTSILLIIINSIFLGRII